MTRIVLLGFPADRLSETLLEQIRAMVPDKHVLVTDDRSEIEAVLDDIEIAVDRFPHDLIPKARNLRWLQQWGAGADWLLRYPEVADLDFILTNASGIHAIPISEHIFAFLFAFARGFPLAIRAQVQREWVSYDQQKSVFELAGKTMLLIGLGAIGSRTATVATALGMRVLAIRRNPSLGSPGVDKIFGLDQLLEVLPQADFVVVTLPLTHQTKGLIGEAALRAMKSSAYLINIGRGGTIREDVLLRALKEEWIAGAGLDVFETEPLPADSPLWALDNLIITGHYAGATPHYDERALAIFMDNLQRYQAGESLANVVDKKLGY
ncbi:MAG: D-2-hydroxyacid dehydrogenase [Anaerolineae bacterium]|nr:D-2-hydroxyacid dehydrogenase [Anaerolineae bacterium]